MCRTIKDLRAKYQRETGNYADVNFKASWSNDPLWCGMDKENAAYLQWLEDKIIELLKSTSK